MFFLYHFNIDEASYRYTQPISDGILCNHFDGSRTDRAFWPLIYQEVLGKKLDKYGIEGLILDTNKSVSEDFDGDDKEIREAFKKIFFQEKRLEKILPKVKYYVMSHKRQRCQSRRCCVSLEGKWQWIQSKCVDK